MACFTDLDYRNKSYPLLQTIRRVALTRDNTIPIPSYGCYDAMSDSAKMYQFYYAFIQYSATTTPISENCFTQKTEDQQLFLLNEAFEVALEQNFGPTT
jgi:hypothetical protein